MIEFCLFSERLVQDPAHVKHWLRDLIGFSNGRRTVDVVFQVGAVLNCFIGILRRFQFYFSYFTATVNVFMIPR